MGVGKLLAEDAVDDRSTEYLVRVPTVMENHGVVMEKKAVMESHGKVMETEKS